MVEKTTQSGLDFCDTAFNPYNTSQQLETGKVTIAY